MKLQQDVVIVSKFSLSVCTVSSLDRTPPLEKSAQMSPLQPHVSPLGMVKPKTSSNIDFSIVFQILKLLYIIRHNMILLMLFPQLLL